MKQLVLAFALTLLITAAGAQDFRLMGSIGGNMSVGYFKSLNFVIDRYNQTRQGQNGAASLKRDMRDINVLVGLSWRLGLTLEGDGIALYGGLSRTGRSASTYAIGTDVNGNEIKRDLKFTANSVSLEAGAGAADDNWLVLLGGSGDFMFFNTYTKTNTDSEWSRIQNHINIGMTLFTDISYFPHENIGVSVRPYYQFGFFNANFSGVNKKINPATYQNDFEEDQHSAMRHFGLQLSLTARTGQ